jgi:hypothetical protein
MKKTIASIVSIILLLTICSSAFAEGTNETSFIKNQTQALKNHEKIIEKLKTDKNFAESYSGAYIDEEGNLNINVTNGYTNAESKVGVSGVKYHEAKRSYKKLTEVQNKLSLKDLNVAATELDEKNNKVIVYLNNYDDASINNVTSILDDKDAVEFRKQDQEGEITLTANVVGGHKASWTNSLNQEIEFTVGFAAQDANGNKGFLIPGHITAQVGASIKYDGKVAGTLKSKAWNTTTDASFVQANSSYTPVKSLEGGETYTNAADYVVQGQTVYAYGMVSGKQTGTIQSVSFKATVEGQERTYVKANYKAIPGDSGAPVATWQYAGSGSSYYLVTGMQSASYLVNEAWVNGTSYSLFVKSSTIMNALNLSGI